MQKVTPYHKKDAKAGVVDRDDWLMPPMPRKLKARWTPEAAEDIKAFYSPQALAELLVGNA